MSELKVYHHELRHNEYEEFYLKSEADKVIAELKADYQEACDRLQTANLIKDEQLAAARHQKRKRCLALAKIASDNWHIHNSFYAMGKMDFEQKKCERYERHRLKWLAIADKFKDKEAK